MFYFMEDYAGAEKEFLKALKLTVPIRCLGSVIYGTLGDNRPKMEDGPSWRHGCSARAVRSDNSMILNNYSYYLSEKDEKLSLADKMSEKACRTVAPET